MQVKIGNIEMYLNETRRNVNCIQLAQNRAVGLL